MRPRYLTVAGLVASGMISIIGFALLPSITSAQTKACYPPEYNASGDLILPRNFHEWIYVGSPLTPNALNGGEAGFPEYHNVYIAAAAITIPVRTVASRSRSDNSAKRS